MKFMVSAVTDIGLTKNTNQDSYCAKVLKTRQGQMAFAILCDGMGGLAKGEVASSSLVRAFARWCDSRLPELCETEITDSIIREEWVRIATEYNEKIKDYGSGCGIQLGTTITVILLTESRYYLMNVGDTRAYEIVNGVRVLTQDQTVVAREVMLGRLTEEEAKVDPRRSVLLQCVGASETVYPDLFFGDTMPNAVYMLCSDGFRHEITEGEIFHYFQPKVMNNEAQMEENAKALVGLNKERKERDNITVITVRTM